MQRGRGRLCIDHAPDDVCGADASEIGFAVRDALNAVLRSLHAALDPVEYDEYERDVLDVVGMPTDVLGHAAYTLQADIVAHCAAAATARRLPDAASAGAPHAADAVVNIVVQRDVFAALDALYAGGDANARAAVCGRASSPLRRRVSMEMAALSFKQLYETWLLPCVLQLLALGAAHVRTNGGHAGETAEACAKRVAARHACWAAARVCAALASEQAGQALCELHCICDIISTQDLSAL